MIGLTQMNDSLGSEALGSKVLEGETFEDEAFEPESANNTHSLNSLTSTDRGNLPEETRRTLVQLLKGPYLSEQGFPTLWATLLRGEDVIREQLGNLFLDLVIDPTAGVAFVRNMESEERVLPKVVRSLQLTLLDTALVLYLREQLLNAEATGRRAFVGLSDMADTLGVYRNIAQTDQASFNKRVNASIKKMQERSVLQQTSEEGRFEISPVLRMIFDADQVIAVTKEIKNMISEGAGLIREPAGMEASLGSKDHEDPRESGVEP